jgi:hypothetical protein
VIRLEFFDGAGAPIGARDWEPRDGIVFVPRDTEQLRLTLLYQIAAKEAGS